MTRFPRKDGLAVTQWDMLVINDYLAPYIGTGLDIMAHDSKRMRNEKPFLVTDCRTGEGVQELVRVIRRDLLFDL